MTEIKKINWKYIIAAILLLYAVLFGYYVLTSNGLGNKPFYLQLRRFFPMSVLAVVTSYIISKRVCKRFFTSFLIIALAWILVFPIGYKLKYVASMPFFSNHFDIVFAVYTFVGLTALTYLMAFKVKTRFLALLISLVQFFMLSIPLLLISYSIYYKTFISEAAVMAVFQTNIAEAREYLLLNLGLGGICLSILIVTLLIYGLYVLNSDGLKNIKFEINKKTVAYLVLVSVSANVYAFSNTFKQTGIMTIVGNVRNYFSSVEKFKAYHTDNYNKLAVAVDNKIEKPHTVILVIGESASRTYMSAYNKNASYDSTPWLREQGNNSNFYIFQHAYSSWGQTVPSLERALTTKNQYNNIDFNNSVTIIDIAKKAGYYTSWFSNQGTIDVADTPITLVGETADIAKWTNQNENTAQYDGALLEYLKIVDSSKNNFIVLHLMGSHDNYQNRYPREFAKWGNPDINEPVPDYHNSLYYSDYVLSQIYEYAKENLNLQAMVYFSDHGGNPYLKRLPDTFGMEFLRVPLFVYLGDEYKKAYPDVTENISLNKDKYVTNDLIYDLMCGLLNVKSSQYDETQSIASDKYKFTRQSLRTRLGEISLTEDVDEH